VSEQGALCRVDVSSLRHDVHVVLGHQQHPEAVANHRVIVGEDDRDLRRRVIHGRRFIGHGPSIGLGGRFVIGRVPRRRCGELGSLLQRLSWARK
jgi:hypothetical protein